MWERMAAVKAAPAFEVTSCNKHKPPPLQHGAKGHCNAICRLWLIAAQWQQGQKILISPP
jgi:hypothetical protein